MTRQDAARDSAACRPMAMYFLRVCQLPVSLAERKTVSQNMKKKKQIWRAKIVSDNNLVNV